jgi:hypothetical protein
MASPAAIAACSIISSIINPFRVQLVLLHVSSAGPGVGDMQPLNVVHAFTPEEPRGAIVAKTVASEVAKTVASEGRNFRHFSSFGPQIDHFASEGCFFSDFC